MLKAIVAVDKLWGIGKDNKLLCHIPADLAYFKKTTTDSVVVMGRLTAESMPKLLPLRVNVIISSKAEHIPLLEKKIECIKAGQAFLDSDNNKLREILRANDILEGRSAIAIKSPYELSYILEYYQDKEHYIIGGEQIYKQFMSFCSIAYVTKIDNNYDADRFFPNLDALDNWKLVDISIINTHNDINFQFCVYKNDSPEHI